VNTKDDGFEDGDTWVVNKTKKDIQCSMKKSEKINSKSKKRKSLSKVA